MLSLLGARIGSARYNRSGWLRIVFADGRYLETEDGPFENWHYADASVRSTVAAERRRLRAALVEFGFGGVIPEATALAKPGLVWMLGRKPRRIDILTGISGVTFSEAKRGSVEVTVVDTRVPVIGRAASAPG